MSDASPAVRSLRAAVFAAVCVLLAAAAHGLATGEPPVPAADGAGFAVVFAVGWLLGGRERSLPGIGALTLGTQAGLHLAFGALRGRAMAAMPPIHHPGMPMAHPHPHAMSAHVLAALVASWCLRRGEAALWSLLRWAVAFVPGLAAWWRDAPAGPVRPAPGRMSPAVARPRRLLLRYAVSGRGPPAGLSYTP
ncbi:hypothetical protein [Streptomyces geranii]|uniref:hypothetical protein n=1 Tax=Streptomyces geranii TaxID=2058923 RepID=UPI000D034138|nr:hypothetical protein [Streptomyces geranii]